MGDAWIRLDDVRLSRGGRPVLKGITASLRGRAVGLVGANGAGKSTLIGALLGVLRAESGSIGVLDCALPTDAMEVRTRAGVMAEHAGVFPGGSGVEAVMFAGMLSGLPRRESLRRAHRALDALDVGEERYRPARTFSTGMRQRCKLAMSLVHDPEVLILDEPTVGLDPPGRTQLLDLIRELRDEGRRVLISTHILPDAEYLCDELLLLRAGEVAFSGDVTELVGATTRRMKAAGEGMDAGFLEALAARGVTAESPEEGSVVFETEGDRGLQAFWEVAAERGAEIRSLGRDLPTLEDAVLTAMEAEQIVP